MKNPNTFYSEQSQKYDLETKALFKQLTGLSLARFLVFVAAAIGVYFSFSNALLATAVGLVGLITFIYLLSRYTDIKYQYHLKKALVAINKDELKIASGDFHDRNSGSQFQDPKHEFSFDIDLFGKGSFFQFINRTVIQEGTQVLVSTITNNAVDGIIQRQEAIKELAEKPEWRQYFTAEGSLIEVETPALQIIDWLKKYQPFLPKVMQWMPLSFIIGSGLILCLCVFKIISFLYLVTWLLLGLGITGIYLKKINVLASNTDQVKDTFRQYALLLDRIEKEEFSSTLLKQKQDQIQEAQQKASAIFSRFSKHLDALDNRNNFISAIFGNGFFLTDIRNVNKIEHWIVQYKTTVAHWFKVVSFFDAYNSFGNYAFNHSEYVFPEIINDKDTIIEAKALGHPLLEKNKRITSDLRIDDQHFFIVTGANMAGKSTFLRTVSLHIVMANAGLPVCADSSKYRPIKLITSMRTTDSLTDDSSYFFSELTRLKVIVDALENDAYFVILDEILKGTNSTDKAIGSRKFVEKLVSKDATGIIATHDLSLCEIEKDLNEVKNYYFDAQIINDELFFDYKLKSGVCQNMNASFLLKKMNIV